MFGMRHSCGSPHGGKWAARRGWRGHVGPGQGWGGRHGGMGGGEMMRAGRMLAQGAVKLDGETLGGEDLDLAPARLDGAVLQVGRRQFRRLRRRD